MIEGRLCRRVEDDPELSDSIGASPTIGLEMKLPQLVFAYVARTTTSKTGIKATSIITKTCWKILLSLPDMLSTGYIFFSERRV